MAPPQAKSGLFVVLMSRGHIVTRRQLPLRPPSGKGEKRITELLKVGKEMRDLKVSKRKLGARNRAKKKREEIANVLRKMSGKFLPKIV